MGNLNYFSKWILFFLSGYTLTLYNNCAPIHSSTQSILPTFIEPTDLTEQQELFFLGKTLYDNKCSQCHGPTESSTKKGRSANDIFSAIQSVPQMRIITNLSKNDIHAIAFALNYEEGDFEELACKNSPDVGSVAMHRLNYFEYRNTIRSVLGINLPIDPNFPPEEVAEFANTAVKLKISNQHMDWYLESALNVIDTLFSSNNLLQKFVDCDLNLDACRITALQLFTEKAFRRPAKVEEINHLISYNKSLIIQDMSQTEAMKLTFSSILISPQFLYRNTHLSQPNDVTVQEKLDNFELASRISYFLWGDVPDSTLLNKSITGQLDDSQELKSEIHRLLQNPKAVTHLSENFFSYWFGLHKFKSATPNPSLFPEFNELIRQDMITESRLYFQSLVKENGNLTMLLTKPKTYLNRNLAKYYNIPGSFDASFREVDLSSTSRLGILTHGSILTSTSHSSGTSIVRRGAFVALNLQCIEIASPPDGITALAPPNGQDSIRDRLEQHRSKPQCASCHKVMDPPGFGLENFNAAGQFRTLDDEGFPLDTQGELLSGDTFSNVRDLAELLSVDRNYKRCAIQKLSTFALGRNLQDFDSCTIEKIVNRAGDGTLEDIIFEIISSDSFMYERGE